MNHSYLWRCCDGVLHVLRCRRLKRLMRDRWTPNLESLCWNGIPVRRAVGGLKACQVALRHLTRGGSPDGDVTRLGSGWTRRGSGRGASPEIPLHSDLSREERELLSRVEWAEFGKSHSPHQWYCRLEQNFLRKLTLLRRHVRYWRAFVSESGRRDVRRELEHLFQVGSEYLQAIEVSFFLDCGTLLGHFREGDIIMGDSDVDLGLFDEDFEKVWDNRHLLPPGVTLHDSSYRHHCRKMYMSCNGWEVDLYFYERRGETLVWATSHDYPTYSEPVPVEEMLPLEPAVFLGHPCAVPRHTEAYLTRRFGYLGTNARRDETTGRYFPPAP